MRLLRFVQKIVVRLTAEDQLVTAVLDASSDAYNMSLLVSACDGHLAFTSHCQHENNRIGMRCGSSADPVV